MAERYSTGLVDALNITGSFKSLMDGGEIRGFTGTQPDNADLAESGTHLITITVDGAAHSAGSMTNGLTLAATSAGGVIEKNASETWKGYGLPAAGTGMQIGYFRWYDKNVVTGASSTSRRVDFAAGTSSSFEAVLGNLIVSEGGPITVNTFRFTARKQ